MTAPASPPLADLIAELRRLHEEATPAPWSVVDPPWRNSDDMPWIVRGHGDPHGAEPICDLSIQGEGDDGGGYNAEADALLIAAARSALPRLLAAAERAEGLATALEALRLHHPWIGGEDCWCVTDRMPEETEYGWLHEDACNAARAALASWRGSAGGGTTP